MTNHDHNDVIRNCYIESNGLEEMERALYSALKQLNAAYGRVVYLRSPEDEELGDLYIVGYLVEGRDIYYVLEGVDGND